MSYRDIADKAPHFKVGDVVRGCGNYATGHWSKETIIKEVRVWGEGKDGHVYITASGGGFQYDELELVPENEAPKVKVSKPEFWVHDVALGDINGPFNSSQEAIDWVKENIEEASEEDEIKILLTYKTLAANPTIEWTEK